MSAALLGIPRDFEYKGKLAKVAPRDVFIESQFAEWCKAEAALDLWRLKTKVPADFYAEQMQLFNLKVCSKQFVWGTEVVHEMSWSDAGKNHLLWLKMKRGEEKGGDEIERETIDEIAKDAAKWEELLSIMYEQDYPDFFARLREGKESAQKQKSQPASQSPP